MECHAKPDEFSPFERLTRFARAIVTVPKAETAEKEVQYQRARRTKSERASRQNLTNTGAYSVIANRLSVALLSPDEAWLFHR